MHRFIRQLAKDLERPFSRLFRAEDAATATAKAAGTSPGAPVKDGLIIFARLWKAPSIWGPVVVISLALEVVLFLSNPGPAFLFKSFFIILTFAALALTLDIIKGRALAVRATLVAAILIAAVNVFKASGPYELGGTRGWRTLPEGSVLRTRVYTQPGSQRWELIDKKIFKPYVFIPVRPSTDADVRLTVNGLEIPSLWEAEGLWKFAASMAVPIPWNVVESSDFLDILIEVKRGKAFRLTTTPLAPRPWPVKPQMISIGGEAQPVTKFLGMEGRFVVETRIANEKSWVIGILY